MRTISVVIPAHNEEQGIGPTIQRLRTMATTHGWDMELIVVDDGSSDRTGDVARDAGATVIINPINGGYGLSLQRGIRAARHELVAITDADGTYPVEDLAALADMMDRGLDMAVGARTGAEMWRVWWKNPARVLFRSIAQFVAGRTIPDINSGLRMMRRSILLPYLERTCMGFSFTTSITLILMLNGHFVAYRPIAYDARIGASKVRHLRDTLRTAQIMTSIIAAHNPIKLAILVDMLLGVLVIAALALWFFASASIASLVALIVIGGCVAAAPVIFMLGCLGELLRTRTH